MGDLTKNISRSEIACKCGCGFDTMDFATIDMWQGACDHFASEFGVDRVVFNIHSGARCEEHNACVGGGSRSQHLDAKAIDGDIPGVPMQDLYDYFCEEFSVSHGLGLYKTFIHGDCRQQKARW